MCADMTEEARRARRWASLTGSLLGGAAWIGAVEAATGRDPAAPPISRPMSRYIATEPDAREGEIL